MLIGVTFSSRRSAASIVRSESTPVATLDWMTNERISRRSSASGCAGALGKRRNAAIPVERRQQVVPTDRGDDQHQRRNLVQDPPVAVGEHLECVINHHRVERRGPGHQPGQQQHQQEPRLVVADVLLRRIRQEGMAENLAGAGAGSPDGSAQPRRR